MSASSFFPLFSPFLFSLSSLALGRPAPGRGGRGGPAAGDVAAVAAATTTREQVRGVGGGEGSKAELVGGIETVDTGGDGAVVTPGSCGGEGSIGLRLTGGGTADETGASGGGKGAVVRGDGLDGDDKIGNSGGHHNTKIQSHTIPIHIPELHIHGRRAAAAALGSLASWRGRLRRRRRAKKTCVFSMDSACSSSTSASKREDAAELTGMKEMDSPGPTGRFPTSGVGHELGALEEEVELRGNQRESEGGTERRPEVADGGGGGSSPSPPPMPSPAPALSSSPPPCSPDPASSPLPPPPRRRPPDLLSRLALPDLLPRLAASPRRRLAQSQRRERRGRERRERKRRPTCGVHAVSAAT
uniref:DUF834 domain-containing protein n=1 Tax=Oryza barthii TaxID=65489 RepID=A0A0D3HEV2_9ORYZ